MPDKGHQEQPTHLLLSCRGVQAVFAAEEVKLASRGPATMLWDEHGGTFVIRVAGLEPVEFTGLGEPADIRLEMSLVPADELVGNLEKFAAQQNLPLAAVAPPFADLLESVSLAAGHIPQKNLFVYCEEPQIAIRSRGLNALEMVVLGNFKGRRLPSQETDLVIHLSPVSMARIVSHVLALARAAS